MTDQFPNLTGGTDGMTPFEAALAGQPGDETGSPAVALVAELRALAATVADTPVTQARLEFFLAGGEANPNGHRPEPSSESDSVASAAGFMDITPGDFTAAGDTATPGDTANAGDATPVDGNATPVDGNATPVDGHTTPVDGNATPVDGGTTSATPTGEDATDELSMDELAATAAAEVAAGVPAAPIGADGHLGPAEPVPLSALPPLGPTDEPVDAESLLAYEPLPEQRRPEEPSPDHDRIDAAASGAVLAADADLDDAAFIPIASTPEIHRRPLKPLLAMAGTAMAAALVLFGGVWWAQTLSDDKLPIGAASQAELDANSSAEPTGTVAGTAEEADDGSASDAQSDADGPDRSEPETLEIEDTLPENDGDEDPSAPTDGSGNDDDPDTADSTGNDDSNSDTNGINDSDTNNDDSDTTAGPTTTIDGDQPTDKTTIGDGAKPTTSTTEPQPSSSTTAERSTTTRPTAARVRLGGRATLQGSGQPIPGVLITLYRDADNDGDADFRLGLGLTGSDGYYRFDAIGGCFSLEFTAAAGYELAPGSRWRNTCLSGPGENLGISVSLVSDSPSDTSPIASCLADQSNNLGGSVLVVEADNRSADRYVFLGGNGPIIDTDRLGSPDLSYRLADGSVERYWSAFDRFNRRQFRPSDIESVVAVRNGLESEPVSCSSDS